MAIAEPSNELWAAVKAIDNSWPPDNEDNVRTLAEDWRKAGETAHLAGTELSDARGAAEQAWADQAGQAMGQQINQGTVTLDGQRQGAEQQAAMADRYAQSLIDVKNAIVQVIEVNLPAYLQMGNPMYGAAGAAQQQQFAAEIAQRIKALVAEKSQGLQAPPPAPNSKTDTARAGDIAGMIATVAGVGALIPGVNVVAAPVALLAGAAALGLHGADMLDTGSYDDPKAWRTLGGDAIGLIPGVRGVNAALDGVQAVRGTDVVNSAASVALAVPGAKDLMGYGDPINDQNKELAANTSVGKSVALELMRLKR
ncbi:hypothetical protein CFN78_00265 [Amycolatopsis antarctica]|uniref:Outer membrane channel protein CpnT-like N-terminal domain-containing protein n=1 Tax=Amycolatopsis antarctica TaxID=1854586 RepID=A0A263DB32_9PSEU|nr:hypothetical protein [Amycolatopsis antarctica]OZM74717.1 hypothetical protein CFN78_00265 [Amycolatopsis antarctica]